MTSWFRYALILILIILILVILVVIIQWAFPNLTLVDFSFTFYRAARYFLQGERAYQSDFTFPDDGTQHPPYNPIWILLAAVPFSTWSLLTANAMRLLIEIAAIPFLAYLCMRWARLKNIWHVILLSLAPWFSIVIYAGQWTELALIGVLLSFWGLQRCSAPMVAVGLWLVAARINFAPLIALAILLYAWRNKILSKTLGILAILFVVFSIIQPWWVWDLLMLYWDRYIHPRPADSILLLPGWPWSQFILLIASALFVLIYIGKSSSHQPLHWLWAALVCVGLISALHEFTYDWVILMLPLAWLLRARFGTMIIIALYLYPFLWVLLSALQIPLLSPTIIPSAILISVLCIQVLNMRKARMAQ
jgi:hypothetical protein